MKVSFREVHPVFASTKARRLIIESWGDRTGLKIPSPLCMIYTRVGMIPHLTNDTLRIAGLPPLAGSDSPWIYHLSLASLIDVWRACEGFEEGLRRFVGLPGDALTFLSVQDTGKKLVSGYNDTNNVSVFGRGGRTRMDVDMYNRVLRAMKTDGGVQLMGDTDTPVASLPKRVRKSVERTLRFADLILEKWAGENNGRADGDENGGLAKGDAAVLSKGVTSKSDSNPPAVCKKDWWGTVTGGYMELERRRCAAQISGLPAVQGYVIEGFSQFEAKEGEFPLFKDLLKQTVSFLDDKPRMLLGPLSPAEIWEAVQIGIDIFDSSFVYRLTENRELLRIGPNFPSTNDDYEFVNIRTLDGAARQHHGPIADCTCYTCTKHTTAYLHHLLNTDELLAPMLIMIHNVHQWMAMFEKMRKCLELGE